MIFPQFPARGDTVGICAPSAGIPEKEFEAFDRSLDHLREAGFRISETPSVRTGKAESAEPSVRGAELNGLLRDPLVRAVMCAAGGDFLISMLPHVDFDSLRRDPKWIQGYSDPTSLLYSVTTRLDIATIYGVNAGGFWMDELHPSLRDGLNILAGRIPEQHSFDLYESGAVARNGGYGLCEKVCWETPCGPVHEKGRLIGGCMDCLCDVIGTRFDGGADFVSRYASDGLIWYFDIFALKAESVHNTLFRMRDMGLFRNTKAFLFGRILFPGSFSGMSYEEAIRKALGDVPMVLNADLGHVPPKFTLINGALGELESRDGKGTLRMTLG